MRKPDANKPHYIGLDQRITPRSDVYHRLSFDLPDGRQDIGTCVNISSDGLLMRYPESLEPDTPLLFHLPALGARPATVIWSLGGKTGVQFTDVIAEQDYLPLIHAMESEANG